MPFKSQRQAKWMFANKPKMAKEWASETKNVSTLPKTKSNGVKSATKSKSPLRKGKKRYGSQGGQPKTNLKKDD